MICRGLALEMALVAGKMALVADKKWRSLPVIMALAAGQNGVGLGRDGPDIAAPRTGLRADLPLPTPDLAGLRTARRALRHPDRHAGLRVQGTVRAPRHCRDGTWVEWTKG